MPKSFLSSPGMFSPPGKFIWYEFNLTWLLIHIRSHVRLMKNFLRLNFLKILTRRCVYRWERETETDWYDRETFIGCLQYTPWWGSNLQPFGVWTTLQLTELPSQGKTCFFKSILRFTTKLRERCRDFSYSLSHYQYH